MIAYLKKVLSHSAYESFAISNDYVTPNVTYDTEHVHYNPYVAPVISITASVGDILWSDLSVTSTATPTGTNVIPIGICCIATNDVNTNDGKARFIGLKFVQTNGSSTSSSILSWGPTSSVPNIHSGSAYQNTDYDGTGNTAAIVATGNLASYRAANACQSYAPTGTSAGDWYLPAIKELEAVLKIYNNKNAIKNQLTALQTNYSSDCISNFPNGNYWTSTEYDASQAYRVSTESGVMATYTKTNSCYVLPMLQL